MQFENVIITMPLTLSIHILLGMVYGHMESCIVYRELRVSYFYLFEQTKIKRKSIGLLNNKKKQNEKEHSFIITTLIRYRLAIKLFNVY